MDSDSGRTDNGRFAKGNAGGPGRPKGRGYDLQRAAQEAITPEHIGVLMKKALRMGARRQPRGAAACARADVRPTSRGVHGNAAD